MIDFDQIQPVFIKTVEKLIELKYITVNEHISIAGIASQFSNDLWSFQDNENQIREVGAMFTTMEKYYPKMFQEVMGKMKRAE